MDYITAGEAAEKWGVSGRSITYHLVAGRIPGAVKKGKLWLIPADAGRPADHRRRGQVLPEQADSLSAGLTDAAAATRPMPGDPYVILDAMDKGSLRLVFEAEIAYLRGDFARTMACFQKIGQDDALRLRVCPSAIASAISLGDYRIYTEIDAYLKNCVKTGNDGAIAASAELSLAIAAVSCIAPNIAPDWLKAGDLSALPPSRRPTALYLRAKYFNCMGQFEAMLTVAETALSLCASQRGITHHDIYLRLMCAIACRCMGREDEARQWLLEAMRIALPHGFITPFSEVVTALGGLLEQCLEREFSDYYDAVLEQWKRTWKNWIVFHNRFTKDNITLILSLREYHIAVLVAQHVPYAKIAEQQCVSVGRLKNIVLEIYEKLFICGRDELAKYIL
ncbi:MAG: hypothetical protein LLF87_05940 [Eubacteriales bacterium]|nr:hypothetical protein [Eubacteriales bacterium]